MPVAVVAVVAAAASTTAVTAAASPPSFPLPSAFAAASFVPSEAASRSDPGKGAVPPFARDASGAEDPARGCCTSAGTSGVGATTAIGAEEDDGASPEVTAAGDESEGAAVGAVATASAAAACVRAAGAGFP